MAAGMGMFGGASKQGLGGSRSAAAAPGASKGPPPQVGVGMKGPAPMGGRPGGFPKGGAAGGMGGADPRAQQYAAMKARAGSPPPGDPSGMKGPPPMRGGPGDPAAGQRAGAGIGMAPGAPRTMGDPSGMKGPAPMAGTSPRLPPGSGPMARPPTMSGAMPGGRQQRQQSLDQHLAARPRPTPVGTMPAMTSNKGLAGLTSPPIR